MYGKRSEKSEAIGQLSLFDEAEVEASTIKSEPTVEAVVTPRKKTTKKRRMDVSNLPVT